MTNSDLVRPSRDGDQFHYFWAARRCLKLVPPGAELVTISIEAASPNEGQDIEAGIEAIDVTEYYGSTDVATAKRVRYLQLKHSSRRANVAWTAGGLKKTLGNFAKRYEALVDRFGAKDVARRFTFEFETNRPIADSIISSCSGLIKRKKGSDDSSLAKAIGLSGANLANFAQLLRLTGEAKGYLEQRALLDSDFGAFLPDNDKDAPLRLKELVTRKATTEFERNPDITRQDVLQALGVDTRDLYPAEPLIEVPEAVVEREQLPALVDAIVASPGATILHADGGVGKSVVATRIGDRLPEGSLSFVYDCFGNGAYRSASGYRHRPRDGLTQLANEMAGLALCDPLIPTSKADAAAFVRAFVARVSQASAMMVERGSQALLCLIVDAADNAETAALETNDGPSFPRLLLSETLPQNVRLVLTARSHRVDMLRPAPATPRLELRPFSEPETAANLRASFPNASNHDVGEFHRLTSMNPRVQAAAIADGANLREVLAKLGPEPLTVQDTISKLLEAAVMKVRHEAPEVEQVQLDRVCAALATLRPFVPLAVVAETADVPVALVRSIANDLQRPLLVREDAVQFRDEPTETWFRDRFRPKQDELGVFVGRLVPLAVSSPYVAASLPQLMLEAGKFDELVALALQGRALPENGAMARRDVELQRLQFALKAALRAKRYVEAAKLALKAGGEAAADERQQRLLSSNTDLGALFLDPDQMLDQVSRRLIAGGSWTGSELAYEAAFLSGNKALAGDARSRLRIAYDWLNHWVRSPRSGDQGRGSMEAEDIAEIAWAELNLHGPARCAQELRRWRRRVVSFNVGMIVVNKLIDVGRFEDINALALAARNDLGLLLAVVSALVAVDRLPPVDAVSRATKLACSRLVYVEAPSDWRGETTRLSAITALATAAAKLRVTPRIQLARLLSRYLPKEPPGSLSGQFAHFDGERFTYLRAYALRAAFRNRHLELKNVATRELRKALRAKNRHDQDLQRFCEDAGAVLPWHRLWVDAELGRVRAEDMAKRIAAAAEASKTAEGISYRERSVTADEIALLHGGLILRAPDRRGLLWQTFEAWRRSLRHPLFIPTLASLSRRAARTPARQALALTLAREAFDLIEKEREDAQSKADTYVSLARSVLPASEDEAREYFEQAVLVSGKIGDENLSRWQAMLNLAEASSRRDREAPETAYRFARAAELTYAYVVRDKYFDWGHTVEAMTALSPRSSLAILSRWLDRRFGREERILPEIVQHLVSRGKLHPQSALALISIRAFWDYDVLLKEALAQAQSPEQHEVRARHVVNYLRFGGASAKTWGRIQALLTERGIQLSDVARGLMLAQRAETATAQREQRSWGKKRPEKARKWDAIFAGLSLTNVQDVTVAFDRFESGRPPFYKEQFFEQAFTRVSAGAEVAFLDALRVARPLSLYDVRALLEKLPADWRARIALKPAVARLLRDVCRRECDAVSADRYYQPLPWAMAEEASGVAAKELMREAVTAIGDTAVPADANDLFRLVGLLSHLLSDDEAFEALQFGLDLFELSLEESDGDGPWSSSLEPPDTVDGALAGFLWAALASPVAARRWEAAHAIRALCRLGCSSVLAALIGLATRGVPGAFADAQLRFYDRHALLWLMIAIARAADEDGEALVPHIGFLKQHASRDLPHVLIRGFAAQAILSLNGQGLASLSQAQRDLLRSINSSKLPVRHSKTFERRIRGINKRRGYGKSRFSFGMDFGDYWLAPLARRFAVSQANLEEQAERVIRDDWGLDDNGHWDRDARAMRQYFRDSEWRRSRGSNPRIDDLTFYLSYHATLTVAGKLLETTPVHEDPEGWDSFKRWIEEQGLTRSDRLWLADRRDPTPDDLIILPNFDENAWRGSAQDADALLHLMPKPDVLAVSAYWTQYDGHRKQKITINTALATPDRAQSLARALQTAENSHDYKIPDFDDDLEIDEARYALKGWIRDDTSESRFDEFDPWAADLSPRVIAPAGPFAQILGVHADVGERVWRDAFGGAQLWSQVWSDGEESDDNSYVERGKRLLASRAVVEKLMKETGLSLIAEVQIERELVYSRYERPPKKEKRDPKEITRIFVINPGEKPSGVRLNSRPRRGSRRRTRAGGHD